MRSAGSETGASGITAVAACAASYACVCACCWAVVPTGETAAIDARALLSPERVGKIAIALREHRHEGRRSGAETDCDRPLQRYRVALQLHYNADWALHPDCWWVEDAAGKGIFLWHREMDA